MLEPFDQRRYLIPFRSLLLPHIFTDTLVIGGGVAGISAALAATEGAGGTSRDVTLLLKGALDGSASSASSASAWAQGGMAVSRGPDDTVESHFDDTMRAGAGFCVRAAVRTLVEEAGASIDELLAWGMRFDRDATGEFDYGREAAHSHDRILHTDGAATGRELVRCLGQRVRAVPSIRVFDHCFGVDLLTAGPDTSEVRGGEPRVLGALTHHPRYGLQIIWAENTILATGGAGQVYRETTNPKVATGDGLAMAYRAGAAAADLEFVQFHPTTLYVAGASRVLISEAVRGAGASLVDRHGKRFMPDYHRLAELAPRDVVSRAIVDVLERTGEPTVYLDARVMGGDGFTKLFPTIARALRSFEIDPGRDLIPVHPSAHYTIGGVWTDLDGRTTLPGLLACGEAACMGLHGANRLASNSLVEGLVFGRRAGHVAATGSAAAAPIKIVSEIPPTEHAELDLVDVASSLRSAMWRNVGIRRTGRKLDDVLEMFDFWGRYTMDVIFDDPAGWEVQNLLTVGALITRAARWRCETRGVHERVDHPETRPEYETHARWRRGASDPETPRAETIVETVIEPGATTPS